MAIIDREKNPRSSAQSGLPDFQAKNSTLGKFLRTLEWKKLINSLTIWNVLWPFGTLYLGVAIW
jgi:hypothetical protein